MGVEDEDEVVVEVEVVVVVEVEVEAVVENLFELDQKDYVHEIQSYN